MANNHPELVQRVQFLENPELVVRKQATHEDQEAERLLREVLARAPANSTLHVIKWDEQTVEWVIPALLPALRTAGSVYHGLQAIKNITKLQMEESESVHAYLSHSPG
jgi:hypothetical protein